MSSRIWRTVAAVGLVGSPIAAFTGAAWAATGVKPEVGWWSEAQQAPSPLPVNKLLVSLPALVCSRMRNA